MSRFNNISDRYFLKIWAQHGFKVKSGVDYSCSCDVFVCGEFVFQIFMPASAWAEWDKYYRPLDVNLSQSIVAQKVAFEIKTPSTFIVNRNPEFADQLRLEAKSHFSSKSVKL